MKTLVRIPAIGMRTLTVQGVTGGHAVWNGLVSAWSVLADEDVFSAECSVSILILAWWP